MSGRASGGADAGPEARGAAVRERSVQRREGLTRRTDPAGRRRLVTPEGVDLATDLADTGTRIAAFAIDLAVIYLLVFAAAWLVSQLPGTAGETRSILFTLAVFVFRFFYFTAGEMSRGAATPGKRLLRIRVAPRTHPQLSAAHVFTRNAMRELEFFLPLGFAFGGGAGVEGVIRILLFVWAGIFLFFPLLNRDRLRAGDLLAGTWVVRAPRPALLPDLSDAAPTRGDWSFTPAQLDAYGVHELHVLEDVLRADDADVMRDVAARIRRKIDWPARAGEGDRAFLDAYYRALRERLEQGLLLGRRKADKFDT